MGRLRVYGILSRYSVGPVRPVTSCHRLLSVLSFPVLLPPPVYVHVDPFSVLSLSVMPAPFFVHPQSSWPKAFGISNLRVYGFSCDEAL